MYYGYRYYSPELGRWLNRDPIGERGGLNVYAFVINNPIGNLDRLGLATASGSPCTEAMSGILQWGNRKYSARQTCTRDYRLADFDWNLLVPLAIGDWRDPAVWTQPPSVNTYVVTGAIVYEMVIYRKVTEKLFECNCRWKKWKWRKKKGSYGSTTRFRYEVVKKGDARIDKSGTFTTLDAGDVGEHPDPWERAEDFEESWAEEAARLEAMAAKCPVFNTWTYK